MLTINLICVGKMKEKHYIAAFDEYVKRLGAFCSFKLIELKEQKLPQEPSQNEIAAALRKEADDIRANIPSGSAIIAMCIEGKMMSSEELAEKLEDIALSGKSKICFLIGGSCGLDEALKKDADVRLSMSRMTFPHHLARVMAGEQIYRALSITAGSKYHK